MIYLDTSVALAQLLAEDRVPPPTLWEETLVSSRLLHYEVWGRVHARNLGSTHADAVHHLLGRVAVIELSNRVLARALEPFPAPVGTLDAMHLASLEFLRERGQRIELASYDNRLQVCARSLAIPLYPL